MWGILFSNNFNSCLFICCISNFLLLIDKISKKNIRKLNSENFFVFLAIAFTFFFMLRSIFENSFGLFSIDFLIFILSLFILEKQFSEKSILNLKFISNKW